MMKTRDTSNQRVFPGPPFDRGFYEKLRRARPDFSPVEAFVISPEEGGRAFVVKKGCSARIVCHERPQIADVFFWNADDHRERFCNDETLNQHGIHLSVFDRIWSTMPRFRPMMTIIEDTVETKPTHPGARHHILLGAHCNPYEWYWALGDKTHPYVTKYNCYHNVTRAVRPLGIRELHDNLNLFQKARIDLGTGKSISEPSDAKKGDYVEFYAEMNVLVGVSVCPMGSFTYDATVGEQDVSSIGIEIFDTRVQPLEFEQVLQP